MFEIIAKSQPGELKPDTTRAVLDGAIKIVGTELRNLPACVSRMNGVQLCLMELILCDALNELRRARLSLEPAGRGSGIPASHCESAPTT